MLETDPTFGKIPLSLVTGKISFVFLQLHPVIRVKITV